MSRVRVLLALMLAATAIAVSGHADPAAERCTDESTLTFAGWEAWTAITPKPVVSKGHGTEWVKIYVNDLAESTYLNRGAPYPECAKIVKPLYNDAGGTRIDKLTVMIKMASGYDPENGDWWYALYGGPGVYAREQGRLSSCIPCHKRAAETDYLFSKEVLDAANP